MGMIENLEAMLAKGDDSALLRYSLGTAHFKQGNLARACEHLARAVAQDASYSAAWKAYGQALAAVGRVDEAQAAYASGIRVAEGRGDLQAAKEMGVFLKRLQKNVPAGASD
ncbi:MAG: tetratricopeptide repeat protein [Gammaproteobacteria bacterium]|nr:tetratricopeptide repeat protein [Gammaproteobacteria bacterium]